MEEPQISGAVLLNNFRAFEEEVGSDAFASAIESLPDEVAEQYHALVPVAWMPSSMADQIFAAIAKESGRDLEELFPTVIERGVEKTLGTVWRVLARFASDKALLSRGPKIFSRSYSKGKLATSFPEPGVCQSILTEWPNTPRYRLLAIAAGMRTVLRLTGRQDVVVKHTRTEDGACFRATWAR